MRTRLLLLGSLLLVSSAAFAADITGTWQITISGIRSDGTVAKDEGMASLKQSGDTVTGWIGPDEARKAQIIEGTVKDNKIIIKASPQPNRTMTFELTISGDKLVGSLSRDGDNRVGTVEFVKSSAK